MLCFYFLHPYDIEKYKHHNFSIICSHIFRIDENDEKWNLSRVAVDALGAAMLVTIILDLWRIFLGPIVPIPESRRCGQPGLAWFQVQNEST